MKRWTDQRGLARRRFLMAIRAGEKTRVALEESGLLWGMVSAWRRWDPAFRRAHDEALRQGRNVRAVQVALRHQG